MADNNEFNNEPVFYCKHCLSLKIKSVPGIEELDYCDECGVTDIGKTDINTWRQMYIDKFGFDYLDNF
jgi:hypothetical protein